MYFYVVPVSFAICCGLFLCSFYLTGASVDKSCGRVSLFHHFVAMVLGMWAHYQYISRVEDDASFGQNTDFPLAVVLQHFNLGYFLCDSIHVMVWDQKWVIHHAVALAGYTTSEIANVFGLANAVNTWITELGSLMYSTYILVRSETAYIAFVVLYAISRTYFAFWSFTVFRQVWKALQTPAGLRAYPAWAPYCAATLQVALLVVNVLFLCTHLQKLWRLYGPGRRSGAAKKSTD
mmetsp:Transcript_51019/g.94393  ORF Transcript_51019/g.94393 Transcript_51019/m.94393 type:complete len:235 (+) Transcript_51019:26-730(+)